MMDIDGFQKSKVTGYGNSDSDDDHPSAEGAENDAESGDETLVTDSKLKKDMETHKHIFREKHAKYLQYLKGDFEF